jgi:phosphatidylserine/phosphatidylglycerophosphate/cardiolipin synthase-like enzyme
VRRLLFIVMLVATLAVGGQASAESLILKNTPVEVYFSPDGGAQDAVVREIDKARSSILVFAYSFTSAPIGKALVAAHRRGVQVGVILDREQNTGGRYTEAMYLKRARAQVFIDSGEGLQHNKVMVIDRAVVVTGSFNFSKSAEEHNAENLLVIQSPELAGLYGANWAAHRKTAEKF